MKSLLVALVVWLGVFAGSVSAGDKKIGIIVFDGVLTSDVTAPIEVFGAASKKAWFSEYNVVVVSSTKEKKITTEEGLVIVAEKTIYDDMALDVVIVASAYDMNPHLENKELIQFITTQSERASWLGSNCSGATLLGKAGLLDGKKATTWAGGEKQLQKQYPDAKVQFDQNVVIDDKLITSNGGPVSYQAAFLLLEQLSTKSFATEISESIQFNRLESAF